MLLIKASLKTIKKLNSTVLHSPLIKEEITRIRKYLELNDNENSNLWDAAKAAYRGNF